MEQKNIIILLLVILLVIAVGFIAYERIYTFGFRDGRRFMSDQLISNALQCKAIPLNYIDENNQTRQINLIAAECLQRE